MVYGKGEGAEPAIVSVSCRFGSGESSGSFARQLDCFLERRRAWTGNTSEALRFAVCNDLPPTFTTSVEAPAAWLDGPAPVGRRGRTPTLPMIFLSPTIVIPKLNWIVKLVCREPSSEFSRFFWFMVETRTAASRDASIGGMETTL